MNEKSLVLIKPDGVKRGLAGEIISRFEKVGLKIVGMKMVWVDENFAKEHYTEDITKRRGEKVRTNLLKFIKSGPVIAMCVEGIEAIEVIRKIVGETEPKSALPGTIRGDYSHISYGMADKLNKAIENLIHASANKEDAEHEVSLWFAIEELHNYKIAHEEHVF
ncbi:nucleoside-diphosphate kinase [archaeon]|nr:nucleoside-diphosphate kinase [archaeon]